MFCGNKLARLNQLLRHYPASTMKFIWFTDEKLSTVSAPSNSGGMKSRQPETQPSRELCVPVHCLAGTCKSQTIHTGACVKANVWGFPWGWNSESSTFCHQWTRL